MAMKLLANFSDEVTGRRISVMVEEESGERDGRIERIEVCYRCCFV